MPKRCILAVALLVFGTCHVSADDASPAIKARLTRLDGSTEVVSGLAFSTDSRQLLIANRTIPVDDLRRIESVEAAPTPNSPSVEVTLTNGSRLLGHKLQMADEQCLLGRSDKGVWSLRLEDVLAIRCDLSGSLPAFATAVAQPSTTKDRLFVKLGDETSALDGYLEKITTESASFDWMNESRTIPRAKFVGVVFAQTKPVPKGAARFQIDLHDGSRLLTDALAAEPSAGRPTLKIACSAKTSVALDWPSVRRINLTSSRLRFVSDLRPIEATDKPIVALPRVWQTDRSVTGKPLTAGDQSYDKGLGVQSGSRLVFDIGGGWSSFAGVIALDPKTGREGDCVFVIRGDGRELVRERLRGSDLPKSVKADVSKVGRLELIVEYGENLDFGDHANWCDACLVQSAAQSAN